MDTKKILEEPKSLTDGLEESSYSQTPISLQKPQKPTKPISVSLSPLLEIYKTVKENIKNRGREPKYKTGLTELDDLLWGVHKQELLTLGARTSQGKTDLALYIATNLADKHSKVIYFSLEMTKEQLLERMITTFCKVDNELLRKGIINIDAHDKSFTDFITHLKFHLNDREGYDFAKIVEVCEIIKPDFVVIDYIQMIATKGFRSKLEAIEEFVRKIKQMSVELNFGTILVSQLNRGGATDPNMSHLKWAGVLEEHSDTVITCAWDWAQKIYTLNVEKQRHGPVGVVKIKFIPQYSKFEDL